MSDLAVSGGVEEPSWSQVGDAAYSKPASCCLSTIAESSEEISRALAYILVVALLPENSTPQRLSRCARTNLYLLQSNESGIERGRRSKV